MSKTTVFIRKMWNFILITKLIKLSYRILCWLFHTHSTEQQNRLRKRNDLFLSRRLTQYYILGEHTNVINQSLHYHNHTLLSSSVFVSRPQHTPFFDRDRKIVITQSSSQNWKFRLSVSKGFVEILPNFGNSTVIIYLS